MKTAIKSAFLGLMASITSLQAQLSFNNTDTFSGSGGSAPDYTGWSIQNNGGGTSWSISGGTLNEANSSTSSTLYKNSVSGAPAINGTGLQSFTVRTDFAFNPSSTTGSPLFGVVFGQNGLFTGVDYWSRLIMNCNPSTGTTPGSSTYFAQFQYQGFNGSGTAAFNSQPYVSGTGQYGVSLFVGKTYTLEGDFTYSGSGNSWGLTASLWDTSTGNLVTDLSGGNMQAVMGTQSIYGNINYIADFGRNFPGTVSFDNISIQAAPEPSTMALALLGGFGLLAIRRKE